MKTGYPPRPLTLVPELPLSSLDLKSGEQLIVQETALSSSRGAEVPKPQPKASLAQALNSRSPPGQRLNPPARPTQSFDASVVPSSSVRSQAAVNSAVRQPAPAPARQMTQQRVPSPKRKSGEEVESVEVDGGWLVHRVCTLPAVGCSAASANILRSPSLRVNRNI